MPPKLSRLYQFIAVIIVIIIIRLAVVIIIQRCKSKFELVLEKRKKLDFKVCLGGIRRGFLGRCNIDDKTKIKNILICHKNTPVFTKKFAVKSENNILLTNPILVFMLIFNIILDSILHLSRNLISHEKNTIKIKNPMPHNKNNNNNNFNESNYYRADNNRNQNRMTRNAQKRGHSFVDSDSDDGSSNHKIARSSTNFNRKSNSQKNFNKQNKNKVTEKKSSSSSNNKPPPKPNNSKIKSLVILATKDKPWLASDSEELNNIRSRLPQNTHFTTEQFSYENKVLSSQSKGNSTKLKKQWDTLSVFMSMKDFVDLVLGTPTVIPGTNNRVDCVFDEYTNRASNFKNAVEKFFGITNASIHVVVEDSPNQDDKIQVRNLYGTLANLEFFNIVNLNKIMFKFYDNSDQVLKKLSCENKIVSLFLSVVIKKAVYNNEGFYKRNNKCNSSDSIWAVEDLEETRKLEEQAKLFRAFVKAYKEEEESNMG